MLTFLFTASLLSAAPAAKLPPAPAPHAVRVAAAAQRQAVAPRPPPSDVPSTRAQLVRSSAWTAGGAQGSSSRPWGTGAAGSTLTLRGALFSVPGHALRLPPLASVGEPLTHAAAARERFEQARTQLLTSAGMGVAGLLTSSALRLLGAPMPRLPEVMGLRLAPLQTLPLSISVQGSLP